ncbi:MULTISPECIES: molybdenum ABC transporter ATP-binding protein [Agrobacterium]|uniref:Molybdenum ABC transporter ATP-binding protein n=1 Tax=Agrobacterium tumefaciens TaxID=358 RepID=A0AAE6BDW8_AGRTU|nr:MULTISPECIES: molybdenum ABC transporter ATP-binding protein [Agrobacterium]QCL74055.1 molybdenum ABC transporter ATP-binding protein [Agrobacterium tumefaciens]QCL79632.1 molybdenum ABC transporter ATP-binding protein [Agrobacterium tumefaciens]CUX33731.1 molybdenum ABC transporter (ATP-binding protein) [Agrobacterium sp. NCPPB 925]
MTLSVSTRHRLGTFELDASFTSEGGVTALFGRSGSGKTSMIRIIAGLLRPDEGQVSLDGELLADSGKRLFLPAHKRRFGYVFQEARLFPHLSVAQNLRYGRWFAAGKGTNTNDDRIIDMLGIGHLLQRHPNRLSGGEKQRVAIGRALLSSPRLLLMDEPLASLDEQRKAEIIPYLERLRDETKIPIVYVSHSIQEVARLADRIVVMKDGKVEAEGKAAEVLSRPDFSTHLEWREAGSILSGNIESFDERHGLAAVRLSTALLQVPAKKATPDSPARVLIPARDVMLALVKPEGLSALNILEGHVANVSESEDGMVTILVDCSGDIIQSRITDLSRERLHLEPGKPVHAIIKSAALDPY